MLVLVGSLAALVPAAQLGSLPPDVRSARPSTDEPATRHHGRDYTTERTADPTAPPSFAGAWRPPTLPQPPVDRAARPTAVVAGTLTPGPGCRTSRPKHPHDPLPARYRTANRGVS
jgi:hypothetical protein